jgi:hypothetical protein
MAMRIKQLPVAGCQLPVASCQLPVASCQLPATSYQLPAIVDRTLEAGSWQLSYASSTALTWRPR